MAVLESTQFNQLVQEVREALLAGSQGVGEVEVVTSLANLVSLPALRLVGATETVVEAPLELLSAPAVDAAADARKATEDAIIAAVNAEAAADLSEAERKDLDELKVRTSIAGEDAAAKGDKAFAGAVNSENAILYAMKMASYLQAKLERAQVIILSGEANRDVLDNLNLQVQGSILICTSTRDEAYAAVLQLRELQKQVAQAIVDAYVHYDCMALAVGDAKAATTLANRATGRIYELSERTERVITESIIQTGASKQTVIRLEDLEKGLLFSRVAADIAAGHATKQGERAEALSNEMEQLKQHAVEVTAKSIEVTGEAEKAIHEMFESTANADNSAAYAREKADKADKAAEEALYSKAGADIAATRALAAEQRANDAAQTAENVVSGIRPDWNESDKTNSNYIANKPEVPTLDVAPTVDTLTYTNRDGKEISFKIGDEVRVLEDDEYIFYKLYDFKEGVASWDESGSGSLSQNIYLAGANYASPNVIEQGYLKQ